MMGLPHSAPLPAAPPHGLFWGACMLVVWEDTVSSLCPLFPAARDGRSSHVSESFSMCLLTHRHIHNIWTIYRHSLTH